MHTDSEMSGNNNNNVLAITSRIGKFCIEIKMHYRSINCLFDLNDDN